MLPTLKTERLSLEPLGNHHLSLEIELDADPEVMKYIERPQTSQQTTRAHKERLKIPEQTPGFGYWVDQLRDEPVGFWYLAPPERPEQIGDAELAFRLHRRFWGRGLATEGARAVLDYAFTTLGLGMILAEAMAVNEPSKATMSKLGMRFRRAFHLEVEDPVDGAEHGDVEYVITKEEWDAGS